MLELKRKDEFYPNFANSVSVVLRNMFTIRYYNLCMRPWACPPCKVRLIVEANSTGQPENGYWHTPRVLKSQLSNIMSWVGTLFLRKQYFGEIGSADLR